MVKPDVKHNYYADLELPTNASLDDVRKAYRKLALQYHPDRNAGKEEECVPKFQAIQQANEVLGDATIKQKYDADRRKAGLYPSTQPTGFTPRQPTPGNPYAATSAYPPPPRRTQPGAWQQHRQPPPTPGAAPNAAGATGADRFSNFPRPSHPTAKKDHAQDRTNMYQAWQNLNTSQTRQSRFNPQQAPPQPPPQQGAQPQPQTARARQPPPQPPPRPPQTNTMPTEEQIRAGTKYRQPPPAPGTDGLNERQKAWQAFEQNGPAKPGINRSNTTRTPKKQGFNPNAPGSDERAAPSTGGGYVHRNKSADFGRPRQFPPPPPGAPPAGHAPSSPLSPKVSPTSTRPGTDPTRPDRTQVPFAEGNRNRTPYSSTGGEQTGLGSDMRRSHSTRDTTKLGPEDAANRNRARSTSPPRRESTATNQSSGGKPFVMYSSSSASSSASDMAQTPEGYDSSADKQRPGAAPDASSSRPKKTPTAPSSRFNGARSGPASPMPPTPGASDNNGNGVSAEGMQQKPKPNMYANPSPFDQKTWITAMFGSLSTSRAKQPRFKVPSWAIPGSVNPSLKRDKPAAVESQPYTTAADRVYICATNAERQAYIRFQALLQETFGVVPYNLDMTLFNTLVSRSRSGVQTGEPRLDHVVARLLSEFPSVGADIKSNNNADHGPRANNSFHFPNAPDLFSPSTHKSRSEENINTKFSPDGWSGTFTGEPDYFAAPNGTSKSRSPPRRPVSSRTASSQRRAATMDEPKSSSNAEASQRLWGSDGQPKDVPPSTYAAPSSGFSSSDWQQRFQDPSWTMPPPPPNPPSPSKMGASAPGSRRPSRTLRAKKGQTFQSHVDGVTVEVEDDDGKHDSGVPNAEDFDAMDIDDTPPAQRRAEQTQDGAQFADKEARLYSVPPSAWRQQQEQAQGPTRHRATSSASRRAQRASAGSASGSKLNTNLDDLRNVEPISRTANPNLGGGGGMNNMSSLGDDLPFQSASAKSIPPETLQKLDLPNVPTVPELPRRWSKLTWHMYAEHFADYLKRQHEFNKKMLSYFAVRLQSDEQLISTGNKAWLESSGVTQDGIGFDAYARDVRRDEEMRAAWDIGCERHRKAVREFGDSRDRVKSLAQAGSLPE